MANPKQTPESPEERAEAQAAYDRILEEAATEPIKYLQHDSRMHDDEALCRLVDKHGMDWYGWYWLLAELLCVRMDHSYNVSDDYGWKRLAHDRSCMQDMSIDECRQFVAELYAYDLIHREQYDEMHQIVITRIRRDATSYAEDVAGKRLGAWKTNRKRLLG